MSLGNVDDLKCPLSLACLSAPEVDFLLCPRDVDLVVKVLYEVFHFTSVPRVGHELFHSKLKWLLV